MVHYQNIGQDLVALLIEGCFPNQKEFNDYTLKAFKWNHAMCNDVLVKRCSGKMRFENGLQQYARDLKATVEVLTKL